MIVHFIGATRNIDRDYSWYKKVVDIVHKNGHLLSRNWMEAAYSEHEQGTLEQNDWAHLCRQIIADLCRSDIVIVDASDTSTFGVGYQVALALQQNKPTLLLRKKGMINGAFTSGLHDTFLTRKDWNEANLDKIIEDFLGQEVTYESCNLDAQIKQLQRLKALTTGTIR